jgi:hypothetical protein
MSIEILPTECLLLIFQQLPKRDLDSCSCVNKLWHILASSDAAWSHIAQQGNFPSLAKLASIDRCTIKRALQFTISKEQMLDRLEHCFSLNESSLFRCILGAGTGYKHITIKITKPRSEFVNRISCFMIDETGYQDLGTGVSLSQDDCDFYLENYQTSMVEEPDYSDPARPKETHYIKTIIKTTGLQVQSLMPGLNINETPISLFPEVEQLVLSKCLESARSNNQKIAIASCTMMLLGYVTWQIYSRIYDAT